MAVLLPHALFWFSTLLFRIENPYTQWVWIANPDQRCGVEHPRGQDDSSEMIRKSIYKRWYGDEWEARLKETLIRNVPSQLYLLGGGFWFVILLTPFTIAACLLERCCGIDLAMIIGAVVSLVTVSPYYLWRRKHYDELISNHE